MVQGCTCEGVCAAARAGASAAAGGGASGAGNVRGGSGERVHIGEAGRGSALRVLKNELDHLLAIRERQVLCQ